MNKELGGVTFKITALLAVLSVSTLVFLTAFNKADYQLEIIGYMVSDPQTPSGSCVIYPVYENDPKAASTTEGPNPFPFRGGMGYSVQTSWVAATDLALTVNLPRNFNPSYCIWQWEDNPSATDGKAIAAYQDEEILYFIPSDRGIGDLESYQLSVYRDIGDSANAQTHTFGEIIFIEPEIDF